MTYYIARRRDDITIPQNDRRTSGLEYTRGATGAGIVTTLAGSLYKGGSLVLEGVRMCCNKHNPGFFGMHDSLMGEVPVKEFNDARAAELKNFGTDLINELNDINKTDLIMLDATENERVDLS